MAFSMLLPNRAPRTRRVARTEFRPASPYVAAIDFGTTHCSVTYTLDGSKIPIKCKLEDTHERVPNAIFIDKTTNKVVSFGYKAQAMFSQKRQQHHHIYFERMKMILYRTAVSDSHLLLSYCLACFQYNSLTAADFAWTTNMGLNKILYNWVLRRSHLSYNVSAIRV